MALQLTIKSRNNIFNELVDARAAVKALPEEERASSAELVEQVRLETMLAQGICTEAPYDLPNCYIRVFSVTCEMDKGIVNANFYMTLEDRQNNLPIFSRALLIESPEQLDTNLITFGYNQVKLQAGFEDAVDV